MPVVKTKPKPFPLDVVDYLIDTAGMTNSEHGGYVLSIMAYWKKGESLTIDEMRSAAGRDIDRVCQFYTFEGNRWHHKRIDLELKRMRDRMMVARIKSMKGVEARRENGSLPKK